MISSFFYSIYSLDLLQIAAVKMFFWFHDKSLLKVNLIYYNIGVK